MSPNSNAAWRTPLTTQHDHSRVRTGLRAALLAARNVDGGWSYAPGKRSRIEPTCWATLALGHSEGRALDVELLGRWKRQGGWLVDVPGAPPNIAFNALAALTLLEGSSTASDAAPIADHVVQAKGLRLEQSEVVRQDSSLQAWPWVDGTASWVEPTAWCLLLLKKLRAHTPEAHERIRVGEQFLFDRACHDGGWNYGNKEVYGTKLWPYVPTTALALLAMRDHHDHPVVTRSLAQLQKDVASERSVVAVALAIICMRTFGVDTNALEQTVIELAAQAEDGNVLAAAMMLYALTDPGRQVAFTL